jgi:hypothetical protein
MRSRPMGSKLATTAIVLAGVGLLLGGLVLEAVCNCSVKACVAGFLGVALILFGALLDAINVRRRLTRWK